MKHMRLESFVDHSSIGSPAFHTKHIVQHISITVDNLQCKINDLLRSQSGLVPVIIDDIGSHRNCLPTMQAIIPGTSRLTVSFDNLISPIHKTKIGVPGICIGSIALLSKCL